MQVLLDNGVDFRLTKSLSAEQVTHVRERNWGELSNSNLIRAAEDAGFDVLLTVDKCARKEQNLTGRKFTIITLDASSMLVEDLTPFVGQIRSALKALESSGQGGADIVISRSSET